jgi:hypothetical protein
VLAPLDVGSFVSVHVGADSGSPAEVNTGSDVKAARVSSKHQPVVAT